MKLEKSHYWKALVEIEANNIAFATAVIVHRKGMRIESLEVAKHQPWLSGSDILFDVGKRMKGWIKEQARTMKPSLADKLRYSLSGNSVDGNKTVFGHIVVAALDDLLGLPESSSEEEFKKPDAFKFYPYRDVFVGENKKYVNSYYYLLPKAVKLKAELFCWTKDFTPKDCRSMLEIFGAGMGIGDHHSQGYGKFRLIDFKITEEGDIL